MIEAGRIYIAKRQGTAITPRDVRVEVVWVDGENVHYRLPGGPVLQTPVARFEEIIAP